MGSQGEGSPWPDGLLDIPIQDDIELDTHNTGGEHTTKEYGSWQQFNLHLEEAGLALPSGIEDPVDYYMLLGPGRFHRAYVPWTSEMLAGMTTRPDENGGRQVDTLITVADPSYAATAVRRILERNVFGEFAGSRPLPHTKHVTIPAGLAGNLGVKRAIHDLAIPAEEAFVIPMPNIVTPELKLDEAELEKAKDARPADFTGVFRYVLPDASNTSVEEFYREGEYAGKIVTVSPDDFMYEPVVNAFDSDGNPLDFGDMDRHSLRRQIHFLKIAAENDPDLAELIVAG